MRLSHLLFKRLELPDGLFFLGLCLFLSWSCRRAGDCLFVGICKHDCAFDMSLTGKLGGEKLQRLAHGVLEVLLRQVLPLQLLGIGAIPD